MLLGLVSESQYKSMSARQGVNISMALVHAELTWQFQPLAKVPIIDFKFFVGDYVPGYSNLGDFGFRQITGGGSRWGWNIRVLCLLLLLFLSDKKYYSLW